MTKRLKIWLIIATSLVLIGSLIFVGVMTTLNWDFKKLSTKNYGTTGYVFTKEYRDIKISTKAADIVFLPSEIEATKVECFEYKNVRHSVAINDEVLEIRVEDNRKWFQHIGINWSVPKITIYIPKGEYGSLAINSSTGKVEISNDFTFERMDISVSTGDIETSASVTEAVKIKASTGDIIVQNITAKELDLSATTGNITAEGVKVELDFRTNASTGDISLTDVTCRNIISNANTGDMAMTSVIAAETFSIKRSTGNVSFENCDATDLYITTDTGSVVGTLKTSKVFIVETDTGSVNVPKTTEGGKCEITTDTGNIKIDIVP